MTALFWIVAVILLVVMVCGMFNSTAQDKSVSDRYADLLVGVVAFVCFIMLVKTFGGTVL